MKKYLNATSESAERPRCKESDATVITRQPGCCICISTADCIPILLYDRKNQVGSRRPCGLAGTVNLHSGN